MSQLFEDLYQFTNYVEPINLSFNQYLLNIDEPILVHTGSIESAKNLIPQIKDILKDKKLSYIFVSHFESDECGGLEVILKEFPGAKVIASEVTARQLDGFGITKNILIKHPKDEMKIGNLNFKFINYPSEMHLWDGLLLLDLERKILFSSDLMIRFGNPEKKILENTLEKELNNVTKEQIPDNEKREKLIEDLKNEDIKFIATGHGECIKII